MSITETRKDGSDYVLTERKSNLVVVTSRCLDTRATFKSEPFECPLSPMSKEEMLKILKYTPNLPTDRIQVFLTCDFIFQDGDLYSINVPKDVYINQVVKKTNQNVNGSQF